jgi:hypothetical protein
MLTEEKLDEIVYNAEEISKEIFDTSYCSLACGHWVRKQSKEMAELATMLTAQIFTYPDNGARIHFFSSFLRCVHYGTVNTLLFVVTKHSCI